MLFTSSHVGWACVSFKMAKCITSKARAAIMGMFPQIFRRGTTCFMSRPPKTRNRYFNFKWDQNVTETLQSVHATRLTNQFPFNSAAKVAARRHHNSSLFELKKIKKNYGGPVGRGHPLPTPYPTQRLDPPAFGARPPNLQQKSPPVIKGHLFQFMTWRVICQILWLLEATLTRDTLHSSLTSK